MDAHDTSEASLAESFDQAGERRSTSFVGLGCAPNTANRSAEGDEAINKAIAQHQDGLQEWRFRSVELVEVIRRIHDWEPELWEWFVPKEWKGQLIQKPAILFRFQWERPRTLGHYRPGQNDIGFRWEISVNPRHLHVRSEIEVAKTVLHEMLHCFEDLAGSAPKSRNNYHSSWFRQTAGELGIPCTKYGGALGIMDPSPFMEWARSRGLSEAPMIEMEVEDEGGSSETTPKRVAWVCGCPAEKAVQVEVPRGSKLRARCERCGDRFIRRSS